jgi:hypothetical protein
MSRALLTALAAALAFGAFAPRLTAQDTSSTTQTRPDTSGYTGAGGVDTSARPGRVGATDTAGGGAADTTYTPRLRPDTSSAAGGAGADSTTPGAGDTTGMQGRHAPDSTTPGATTSPGRSGAESNGSADSGGGRRPSN